MSKKPFDICIIEEFEHQGQQKTHFHKVGVAFENDKGGFSGQPFPGAAITGRFVILPRRERSEGGRDDR